jgi:hypothetical protein
MVWVPMGGILEELRIGGELNEIKGREGWMDMRID